jgi:hypothetical protein
VLDTEDADLVAEFVAHPLGRGDIEAHDRLLDLLPPGDGRRPEIRTRLSRLLAEA